VAAWAAFGLCVVALTFGSVPGVEIYEDTNDCLGRALGALFDMHHHGSPCAASYVYRRTEPGAGWPLWAMLVPVALGALAVARWPRPTIALAWVALAAIAAITVLAVTFDLDLFDKTREIALWPAWVMTIATVAVYALLLLVLLAVVIVSIAGAIRRRRAHRPARPAVPQAVALPHDPAGPGPGTPG
jgi:hypothetical protein